MYKADEWSNMSKPYRDKCPHHMLAFIVHTKIMVDISESGVRGEIQVLPRESGGYKTPAHAAYNVLFFKLKNSNDLTHFCKRIL